ncbi:MAG: carboxypeptidase regulatory-like domain-containing protein [Candidatus Omnitrophica bacterium]|nr:carboxypeptidase regulatory-like domain-containing protein [Candidatus Omnitrophota bacterium]
MLLVNRNKQGLTLVEMMVGVVVISLISVAGWVSVSVMTRSQAMARDIVTATNLLQQSQEEVRRVAQADTVFDMLERCDFPPDNADLDCGLRDLSGDTIFGGFDRSLQVTLVNGSPELKRTVVSVTWQDLNGMAQQRRSVAYLSRPPDPLAGNLKGFVCSEDASMDPLGGIRVELDSTTSTASYSTTSVGFTDDDGANFSFAEFDGFDNFGQGRFILPAGSYILTVNDNRYQPYTHPVPITISPNEEKADLSFCLTPKPDEAHIFGNVIDQSTGQLISTFSRGQINLYQNGSRVTRTSNRRDYNFTIAFDDTDPQYFTVNTTDAFRLGYAYAVGAAGAPSCTYQYQREGFSTAVVQDDMSLICSNPYFGSSAADRIEVRPGDNIQLDLPVTPVPEVLITGRVIDSNGQPVANATVRARWPRSDYQDWRKGTQLQTASTDGNGNFTFSVPAVQAMFPASDPNRNFLEVWANGQVAVMTCCDLLQNVSRDSNRLYPGPLLPGDPPRDIGTLVIPVQDQNCGNVGGTLIDDATGNALQGVSVNISVTDTTDATGDYQIACDPAQTGFRLQTNNYRFSAQRSGYYTNESVGNDQYVRRGSSGYDVPINTDSVTDYDARMWPRGFANVTVTVFDQTTGQPMDGVAVVLDPYSGSNLTQVTTGGGVATFSNIPETWPPLGLPADGYYQTGTRNHGLDINHDPANYQPHSEVIQDLRSGETRSIIIQLRRNGGV